MCTDTVVPVTATDGIEIRRSTRRRRTVSARREDGRTVILMPAGLTAAREAELVEDMLRRLERSGTRRRGTAVGDDELMARAAQLSKRHLGGAARPASVRWVPPMRTRWASCTPADGTVRISEAARAFPRYVLDYLLVHELAHLVAPGGHTDRFWRLVRGYPRTERAIGYLEARSEMLARGDAGDPDAGDCEAG